MTKKTTTYSKLLRMAKSYGVDKNALFVQAAEQYDTQMRVIQSIKDALDVGETLTTSKEYIKGRENIYANPLVKELPKHADSANRSSRIWAIHQSPRIA